MQVAIVGAGTIFYSHIGAYQTLGKKVVAVADIDLPRAHKVAKQFGIPEAFSDWQILLERKDIDVIAICTPPKFHREIAVAALKHGKHVICEKPLAPTLQDIDAILEAAEDSKGKLLVCHQCRYLPSYRRIKWLVDEGHLGKVNLVHMQRYDPPPAHLVSTGVWGNWELTGGGVLMTKAIHQIDLLLYLLGPVARVQAMMGTYLYPIESEDQVIANIQFETGAVASLCFSAQLYDGQTNQIGLFGSKASVGPSLRIKRTDDSYADHIEKEAKERFPDFNVSTPSAWNRLVKRQVPKKSPTLHTLLFRDFFDALESGGRIPVSAEDGRAAVELCTAIYQAALTKTTVELPLDPSHKCFSGITRDDYASTTSAH